MSHGAGASCSLGMDIIRTLMIPVLIMIVFINTSTSNKVCPIALGKYMKCHIGPVNLATHLPIWTSGKKVFSRADDGSISNEVLEINRCHLNKD